MEIPKVEEQFEFKSSKNCPSKLNIKIHAENLDSYLHDSNKIYQK